MRNFNSVMAQISLNTDPEGQKAMVAQRYPGDEDCDKGLAGRQLNRSIIGLHKFAMPVCNITLHAAKRPAI